MNLKHKINKFLYYANLKIKSFFTKHFPGEDCRITFTPEEEKEWREKEEKYYKEQGWCVSRRRKLIESRYHYRGAYMTTEDTRKLLLKEKIDEDWIIDLLLELKGIFNGDGYTSSTLVETFGREIWKYLPSEDKVNLINITNGLLNKYLYEQLPKQPCNFWENLVELACFIEQEIPEMINSGLLIKWREENFPNVHNKEHFNEQIEYNFLLKDYYRSWFNKWKPLYTINYSSKEFPSSIEVPYWWYICQKISKDKIIKIRKAINDLLDEEVSFDTKNKTNYFINLLEFSNYLEEECPFYVRFNDEGLVRACKQIVAAKDINSESKEILIHLAKYLIGRYSKTSYDNNIFDLQKKFNKEELNKDWIKDFLSELKGVRNIPGQGDIRFDEYFESWVWKYLTKEKIEELITSLNQVIKEDLFKRLSSLCHIYFLNLICIVDFLEKRIPGCIDPSSFTQWKEENFPNIMDRAWLKYSAKQNIKQDINRIFKLKELANS